MNHMNLARQDLVTCAGCNHKQLSVQTSIRVLWISRSADVPSENLRPPEKHEKTLPVKTELKQMTKEMFMRNNNAVTKDR